MGAVGIGALRNRWLALLPATPGGPGKALACFDELVAAYTGEGRHYRDLAHVRALLALADGEAALFADKAAVELAIFYHDAVYDPRHPKGNEQESADLAWDRLRQLGLARARCEKVARLIEWTAHLADRAAPDDPDTARFLDLDLAILGAPAAAYDAYATAIRQEYAAVADAAYRQGRTKVLAAFLARPRLYLCDDHHAAWDGAARDNMRREAARLAQEGGA